MQLMSCVKLHKTPDVQQTSESAADFCVWTPFALDTTQAGVCTERDVG